MVLVLAHLFLVCWFIVFPSVCIFFYILLWCIIVYFSVPFYSLLSLPHFLLDSSFIIIIYGLSSCSLPSFVELSWYSRTHGIISWITVSTVRPNAYRCPAQQYKANGLCVPHSLVVLLTFRVFGRGACSVLNTLTRALLCGCSFGFVVYSALRMLVHIYCQTHDDWFIL